MRNSDSSHEEIWNVYANDKEGNPVFITAAVSGRNGYFCQGCKREMQAVIPHVATIRPYFRHDATALKKDPGRCTYSDESHRHKLAKEFLVEMKSIRVPGVYKEPPPGVAGFNRMVFAAKTITAHAVAVERDFFEDETGQIRFGRIDPGSERNSIVRPDVIFFNERNQPILFVEMVAEHKVDYEKLIKLKRLGIDTVAVSIPRESPEEIRKCFQHTDRTKWIYNSEYERANYFQLPDAPNRRAREIDPVQRRLFTETYLCRKAEIGELIRGLRRSLEGQQYSAAEGDLRREIEDVESDIRRREQEFRKLETDIYNEVFNGYAQQRADFGESEGKFLREQAKFVRVGTRLEKRYQRIRREIEDKIKREFEAEERTVSQEEAGERKRLEDIKYATRQLGREEEEFTAEINRKLKQQGNGGPSVEQERRRVEDAIGKTIRDTRSLQHRREGLQERFRVEEAEYRKRVEDLESEQRRTAEELEGEERGLPAEFESQEGAADRQFEDNKSQLLEAVKGRNPDRDPGLSGEIKIILHTRGELKDYGSLYQAFCRNQEALRYLNSTAFKTWLAARRGVHSDEGVAGKS